MAGRWKRTSTQDTLQVDVMLYRALAPAESQALDAAAARLATYLNLRPRVTTSLLAERGR